MLLMIIGAVFMLGLSIFIHELGHLLCGKLVGVEARIFSIGYGRGVWKKRIGGTLYQITNIPIGGYVMFKGDRYGSRLKGKKGELLSTPPLKRMIPVLGGPLFNFFLGFVLFFVLALLGDTPVGNKIFIDSAIQEYSPAYKAGLRTGDRIVSVNGKSTESFEDIFINIGLSKGEDISIEYTRGDSRASLTISPEIHEGGRPTIGVEQSGQRTVVVNFTYMEQLRFWLFSLFSNPEMEKSLQESSSKNGNKKYANLQKRALAFLNDGDEILSVDQEPISTVSQLQKVLAKHKDETVIIKVLRKKHPLITPWMKEEQTISVPVLGSDILEFKKIQDLTLPGLVIPSYTILAHEPNLDTKLENLKIDGKKFSNFEEIKKYLEENRKKRVILEASGLQFESDYIIKPIGLLGFRPGIKFEQEKNETTVGIVEAGIISLEKIYQNVQTSLKALGLMITGFISPKDNLSGPVGIVQFAGMSVEYGLFTYLDFIARISIALMIMNLLPIPVADGGHLVLYLFEAVTGKPLPLRIIEMIFKIGFLFLLFLGLYVTFYDFLRAFR